MIERKKEKPMWWIEERRITNENMSLRKEFVTE